MAGLHSDQDNGYSSLEDENEAAPAQPTSTIAMDQALSRLRMRAQSQQDSFVRQLGTSLLSRMARSIFRRWESTRSSADTEQVPDLLDLVKEELCQFAQRGEIDEEYKQRDLSGSLEHDELAEQRRRQRTEYHPSPRRRSSLNQSMEDPTLNLDNLQPERFGPDSPSPISPQRGLADPEEMRSYERNEDRSHRRRHSKRLFRKAEKERRESEKEERRRLRRSVEPSMSPEKADPVGELGEFKRSDLQQKELDTSLLKDEPVGEHSSGEAKVSDDPEGKSLISINTLEAADTASTLQSSVEHTSPEDSEMKSLGSSIASLISDSTSDLQGSEALLTSEIGTSQHFDLPSTESGTSISSDLDKVGVAQKPELPSTEAEKNITPEESSTPSDDFPTGVEGNPLIGGPQETGAKAKVQQEDKERRRMRRTRQVIASLSNRQITSLARHEITTADVLEMLIQLTDSRDRLVRFINGSRSREPDNVDESTMAQFFEGLERAREIANRVPAENLDDSQSAIPKVMEAPLRDPKSEA